MNNIHDDTTKSSSLEMDYTKVKVHPLFEPIKKLLEFMIFGNGFLIMPEFQKAFLNINPAAKPILDEYNKEVKLTVKGNEIHANMQLYLIHAGRLMAIAIFDFLQFSEYNKYLSQTDIFKFAKHIRNGAAHNNKFFFDAKSKRELLKKPIKWNSKIIVSSLMGKTVFPDFINSFSLLYLIQDISKMIESKQTTK
jgi:hypothetical protein